MRLLINKYDNKLNIKTKLIKKWDNNHNYNRCEPTPYYVLKKLFKKYQLNSYDHVVDFGCGLGRVLFFTHHNFKCNITGVEAHDEVFDELILNKKRYEHKCKYPVDEIKLEFALAEMFDILPKHNKFYFFNPFSILIFKKVMNNIIKSYNNNPREIDLILYYPHPQFVNFINNETNIKLIHKIGLNNPVDKYDKIKIYRLFNQKTLLE